MSSKLIVFCADRATLMPSHADLFLPLIAKCARSNGGVIEKRARKCCHNTHEIAKFSMAAGVREASSLQEIPVA